MFLKIVREQLKLYEEDVLALKHKGQNIIEFAVTPIFDKSIKITDYERKSLEKTVKRVENILKVLEDIRDILK